MVFSDEFFPVFAQDEEEDGIIDVEGEETNAMAEEESVEELITNSQDIDTTILFTIPPHNSVLNLGNCFLELQNSLDNI